MYNSNKLINYRESNDNIPIKENKRKNQLLFNSQMSGGVFTIPIESSLNPKTHLTNQHLRRE